MIYSRNGAALSSAYSVDGQSLQSAYDVDGDIVFQKDIKVCTYNVGGWYIGSGTNVPASEKEAYYSLQTGMIRNIDADVLLIEEYLGSFSSDGTSAKTMLESLYPYVHVKTSGTYYGRAVCSKYPITNYTERYFSVETSRYYDSCTITINGIPITFIVTHLSASNSEYRITQATEMFNYVKTLKNPYVIGGDFNSTLKYPFSEVNAAIYNQYLEYGCSIANDGAFGIMNTACNSADWANDAFAIDNIICSDAFTIESVATNIDKLTNSTVLANGKIDHIPLYAVIKAVIQ